MQKYNREMLHKQNSDETEGEQISTDTNKTWVDTFWKCAAGGRMHPGFIEKSQTGDLKEFVNFPCMECGWMLRGHRPNTAQQQ